MQKSYTARQFEAAMEFDGFDWDEGNRAKCQYGVSIVEIERLFAGQLAVGPDPYAREARLRAVGRTAAGRSVFVVFTWRVVDGARLLRPLSARFMHRKEVETYENDVPQLRDR